MSSGATNREHVRGGLWRAAVNLLRTRQVRAQPIALAALTPERDVELMDPVIRDGDGTLHVLI